MASIDWAKLAELVWAAPIAGIGTSLIFSLVVFGAARAGDARRDGAPGLAAAFVALAVISGLVFAAGIAFGITVITTK